MKSLLLILCYFLQSFATSVAQDVYQIGVGIADVTGPAAEVGMMGYGKGGQETAGIHFRLYSRAFVVIDNQGKRVCFVNVDLGMISQAINMEVINRLQRKYGGMYSTENVMLSATHTHSGPGGYLQYVLYIVTSQGFIRQTFDSIVSGIIRSIDRAHAMASVTKGRIYYNEGDLFDTSINRSPTAYQANPAQERARYPYDTDKTMKILKLVGTDNKPLGLISWYPVHATSMNSSNRIISGDNKGYASYLFEKQMNPNFFPGKGAFVAAFPNSNEGDVSPNTMGARCSDTGAYCDVASSTCGGQPRAPPRSNQGRQQPQIPQANEKCIASGPGANQFESTKMIGERQYEKAMRLFTTASIGVQGPISFIHQHIDMTNVVLRTIGNRTIGTCKPAMGYSFAAGTTDGPGAFDFRQGATSDSPFWNIVRDFMKRPSQQLKACHYPKPVLVATGEMSFPFAWQPTILPTQIIKIGDVAIVGMPGEFTTMAGRRIRNAIKAELDKAGSTKVILSGLTNAYSSYVTTFEEYQVQRYEGASTAYGPHTLEAYLKQYAMLASHLANKRPLQSLGPNPPNLISKQLTFKTGVLVDGAPFGKKFGDPVYNAKPSYSRGGQVYVSFIAGHPRNDLQMEKSYLSVERLDGNQWAIVATDASWETRFYWHRTNSFLGESIATIIWDIPADAKPGRYRIRHFGSAKSLLQQVTKYVGVSNEFSVN